MTRPTATVLELQGVLSRIDELQRLHAEPPEAMQELLEQHRETKEEIERLEETIQDAELERRSAEGEIEDQQQKADRYQEQISSVQTQREYGALLTEIDTSKDKARASEEKALAAGEKLEEANQALEEARTRFAELDEQVQQQMAAWEEQKPDVESEIESEGDRAKALREELPPQARAIFERLYQQHEGNAVAHIVSVERVNKRAPAMWRCSECNYSIRPQLVVETRTSEELVLCECGRQKILVVDDEEGAEG